MVRKTLISPRKSPKQRRSKTLVDTILTATTRVLVKGGYTAATTNRIAQLAGVSIGSLYQYFPSKEALIAAIFDQQIERNQKKFEARIKEAENRSFEELLEIVIKTAAETYIVNRRLMAVLFEQAPALQKTQHVMRARQYVSGLLRQVVEKHRDELKPQDLDLAVYVAVHAVLGVLQSTLLEYPKGAREDELVRELTVMVRRYFT